MQVDLERIERRMADVAEGIEEGVHVARHSFGYRRVCVDDEDDFLAVGARFITHIHLYASSGQSRDETEMDTRMARNEFCARVSRLREYGGFRGAYGVSLRGSWKGGMQGVLTHLANELGREASQNAMEAIADREIESLGPDGLTSLIRQLRERAGLDAVSLSQIAASHRELLVELVQNRRRMMKRLWGVARS